MSEEQVKDRENVIANMFVMIRNIICLNISDNTDSETELGIKKVIEQEDSKYIQKMEEGIQKCSIKRTNKRRSQMIEPLQGEEMLTLNREDNAIHKDSEELNIIEENEIGE